MVLICLSLLISDIDDFKNIPVGHFIGLLWIYVCWIKYALYDTFWVIVKAFPKLSYTSHLNPLTMAQIYISLLGWS